MHRHARPRPAARLSALLLLLLACAPAAAIDLACLGGGGGDLDSDISCFLARPGASGPYTLLLDGGSLAEGAALLARKAGTLKETADPEDRANALADLLHPVEGALLTHAHLDHVSGFTIAQTTLLHLNKTRGKPSFRVAAAPETFAALDGSLYDGATWGSFFGDPAQGAVLCAEPLPLTGEVRLGGFAARRFGLDHKVASSAFLLETGSGEAFLYCGDSGPMPADFWKAFHPLVAEGRLKGIAIECSFPAADHALAERTTHLTPDTLLLELAALAGIPAKEDLPIPPARARDLARGVAAKLPFPVLVNHVKPLAWRKVNAELALLREAGLRLLVAERGMCYSF